MSAETSASWSFAGRMTRSGKALFECSGCGTQDPAPSVDHECPIKVLVLDPDLADGSAWTVHGMPDTVLLQLLTAWFTEADDGDEITLKAKHMTAAEVEGLPDI